MYHIIANPSAGRRKAKRSLQTVEKIFAERKIDYRVYETTREKEATELAARITGGDVEGLTSQAWKEAAAADGGVIRQNGEADGETEIVVVGGDGTLHEVLNGLAEPSRCRLGLIPSGTGNDFAEAAGIPLSAEKAALHILEGEAKETDFLNVGGIRCLNVGGLGMDVDVLVRCKRGKFFKGKIKYLLSLLQSLFSFKGYDIELVVEGKSEKRRALIAVACNGTQIGGGIRICPASVIDDGKIDVMAVDCMGKREIVRAFSYLMKGKVLEYPAADHYLCERVRVVPAAPCTVQLDGELYDGLDFDVTIERGLKIYR